MLVKILLFGTLSIYSILDYTQTLALIQCGYKEVNPIVLYLIGPNENWIVLLTFKIAFLVWLGTCMVIQHFKEGKLITRV
jgi:uncharacterized membrane protein